MFSYCQYAHTGLLFFPASCKVVSRLYGCSTDCSRLRIPSPKHRNTLSENADPWGLVSTLLSVGQQSPLTFCYYTAVFVGSNEMHASARPTPRLLNQYLPALILLVPPPCTGRQTGTSPIWATWTRTGLRRRLWLRFGQQQRWFAATVVVANSRGGAPARDGRPQQVERRGLAMLRHHRRRLVRQRCDKREGREKRRRNPRFVITLVCPPRRRNERTSLGSALEFRRSGRGRDRQALFSAESYSAAS